MRFGVEGWRVGVEKVKKRSAVGLGLGLRDVDNDEIVRVEGS